MKKILFFFMMFMGILSANPQVYRNFMEAGKFAYADKNYPLARYFYLQALVSIPEDSIVEQYISHSRLRDIANSLKEYDVALNHAGKSIEFMGKIADPGSYHMIEDSLMLANVYSLKNDSAMAINIANEVFGRALSKEMTKREKLRSANLMGIVASHIGNKELAESAYELSAMIVRTLPHDAETLRSLNLYGHSLFHNDKMGEALKTYEEQRVIAKEVFGSYSRECQWANYCIANTLAFMGNLKEGGELYMEVIGWYRDKMLKDFQSLPESRRKQYLDDMIDILQNAIPFGVKAEFNSDEFTQLAYEMLLLTKGLLLATEKSTERIIRENGTSEEIEQMNNLSLLNKRLKELMAEDNRDAKAIINTYAQIKTIDVAVANAAQKYGDNTSFSVIGYEKVKQSLMDDVVLLDFADFKPASKPRQYVCFEIRKDQKHPKVHYICNGVEVDSILNLEKGRWSNLYSGESGEDMKRIIANSLKDIIGDSKTVYYVPSGMIHKLALEAIPDGDDRLGDKYSFNLFLQRENWLLTVVMRRICLLKYTAV